MQKRRAKRYLNKTVLEASKDRMRYLLGQFDSFYVAFSGGKDSWVVLSLLQEIYNEEGITEKINVIFRDEELITSSIIQYLEEIYETGQFNFHWMAIPLQIGAYIMGKYEPFIAWDPARKWHRQPPSYATRSIGVDSSSLDEYGLDRAMFDFFQPRGKVCLMTGIRAEESLRRFAGVTAKEHDNYISQSAKRVWVAKPVYDWKEADVFKYLYESDNGYCPVYDHQAWSGSVLRVSTVLHDRAKSQFLKMKQMEPEFYQALAEVYPAIETSFRYGESLDLDAVIEGYAHTFEGCRQFARDHVGPDLLDDALEYIASAESMRRINLEKGQILGAVSMLKLFRSIQGGSFWGNTLKQAVILQRDLDFEATP